MPSTNAEGIGQFRRINIPLVRTIYPHIGYGSRLPVMPLEQSPFDFIMKFRRKADGTTFTRERIARVVFNEWGVPYKARFQYK